MNTAVSVENLSVQLSREELLFLLYTLKAGYIPGLDPDPLGNLNADQKNLSLLFAERALRARDLVSVDKNGNLVVREFLLLMIATCAFSEIVISLHHFPSNSAPSRFFWHERSGVVVAHTRPEAPLHNLAFVKNRISMEEQVLNEFKQFNTENSHYPKIITTNNVLKTAREESAQNKDKTIKTLVSSGIAIESAKEICDILAKEHAVSALHLVITEPDKTTIQESATILSGQTSSWLMTELEDEKIFLRAIDQSTLPNLLQEWMTNATPWAEIPEVSLN